MLEAGVHLTKQRIVYSTLDGDWRGFTQMWGWREGTGSPLCIVVWILNISYEYL